VFAGKDEVTGGVERSANRDHITPHQRARLDIRFAAHHDKRAFDDRGGAQARVAHHDDEVSLDAALDAGVAKHHCDVTHRFAGAQGVVLPHAKCRAPIPILVVGARGGRRLRRWRGRGRDLRLPGDRSGDRHSHCGEQHGHRTMGKS